MAIRPIDLPAAAGIDYGGGDVRHFSQGDAANVPGLSNPTRNLAERDNLLAEKVNEVVQVVNNQEQIVPLPVIRTNVPPNEEIVVLNYRIPAGFEARVLNAIISTTPGSSAAELDVYYSNSFGGTSGTAVVTTTPGSEFTGDVNFYQTGEFIVALKNTGASTLEISASLILTMRPLGAEGTLLVGSVIEGPKGQPGMTGRPGPPGPPGTGGAGSPGMVWKGPWVNGNSYVPNDVVSYQYSGTYGSWICRVSNTANLGVNDPQADAVTWNYVAYGIVGATGSEGPAGSSGTNVPEYASGIVTGTLVTGNDWLGLGINGYDGGSTLPSSAYTVEMNETYIQSDIGSPNGFASLRGVFGIAFRGSGTIFLPKQADGAKTDYLNSFIDVVAVANGTVPIEIVDGGTMARLVTCILTGSDQYTVKVLNNDPVMVALVLNGVQPLF